MPLFREENFLVIHAGSKETLFLFGLKDLLMPPLYRIPTVVYLDKSSNEYHSANPLGEYEEIHPVQASRIVDVNAFNALLKFIMQSIIAKHPIVTTNHIPMLLIVPLVSYSRIAIENITKFVIETLELTAFNVLDLSIAASYGLGVTLSSVVVNIGHESTQVTPVIGGSVIKHGAKRIPFGGKTIEDELSRMLPRFTPEQIVALKESQIFEVLNDHQDSFYSMADLNDSNDSVDIAKIVTDDSALLDPTAKDEGEQKPNNELQNNSFSFKGETLTVGKERFQGTNKLVAAIAEAVFSSLESVPDTDKKQECYDNIIIVGGTSRIAGLKHAIVIKLIAEHLNKPLPHKEAKNELNGINSAIAAYQLTDDIGDSNADANAMQVPSSIKLAKIPDYFPEWKKPKEFGGAWADVYVLGGEIYLKQIFGANSNHGGDSFIDTDIYEERGPQAIWDVCL